MSRLITREIIMAEYEDAKNANCFECEGLGYLFAGEDIDDMDMTFCKCKRGRALQTSLNLAKSVYHRTEHYHDPDFFDGSTPWKTLPP
jgi:hypothetical protein